MKQRIAMIMLLGVGFVLGVAGGPALSAVRTAAQGNCQTFSETGHTVCGKFLDYWNNHGGLAQQGYPISEEFIDTSPINGKPYTMQYFQRAVFEYHPENSAPNDVLLALLGTINGQENYTQGFPTTSGTPPFYDHQDAPDHALRSFFNAINRKEYDRAYNYYQGAPKPNTNLAPDFNTWVKGYANTASVTLAIGKFTIDAGAGNRFANVPAIVTATQTDGSKQIFQGCYQLHRVADGISDNLNDTLWHISAAKVAQVNTASDQFLGQSCDPLQ